MKDRIAFLELQEKLVNQVGRKVHGLTLTSEQLEELLKSLREEIEFRIEVQ